VVFTAAEVDADGGSGGDRMKQPCGPAELALLPPPGFWAMKLILALPYPILDGFTEELSCFGP
jgi:hypothetical protein